MNKWEAVYNFWASFGIPAYDESSVPNDAGFPRLTYRVVTDSLGNPVSMSADLWYHGPGWSEADAMADDIAEAIYSAKNPIVIDGGYLWITKGTPFAQRLSDPEDDMIRRVYINIQAEYLTAW